MKYLLERFCEPKNEIQFACFVDMFTHLNQLNLKLHDFGNVKPEGSVNILYIKTKFTLFFVK